MYLYYIDGYPSKDMVFKMEVLYNELKERSGCLISDSISADEPADRYLIGTDEHGFLSGYTALFFTGNEILCYSFTALSMQHQGVFKEMVHKLLVDYPEDPLIFISDKENTQNHFSIVKSEYLYIYEIKNISTCEGMNCEGMNREGMNCEGMNREAMNDHAYDVKDSAIEHKERCTNDILSASSDRVFLAPSKAITRLTEIHRKCFSITRNASHVYIKEILSMPSLLSFEIKLSDTAISTCSDEQNHVLTKTKNSIGTVFLIDQEDRYYLFGFGIHPLFQKNGYAKEALQKINELCKKESIEKIYLQVSSDNAVAVHLYESCSYKKIQTISEYEPDYLYFEQL